MFKLKMNAKLYGSYCHRTADSVGFWRLLQKQSFQNMLFPKGLAYDSKIEHYLTPKVNSVFGCVADLSKLLEENKKGDSQFLLDKSPTVPPSEPNVNQILEDTRALAQIWDLYGHLIKEA